MTSWRDNASPRAQADLDALVEPALGFAQQQLAKHGEFFPYAVVIRSDGDTEMIAARPNPDDEHPASTDVIDACLVAVTERRDHLRAAAIVADVRLADSRDAIRVDLEHSEGAALSLLLPYSKKRFSRDVHYGQLQAATGGRHIWL